MDGKFVYEYVYNEQKVVCTGAEYGDNNPETEKVFYHGEDKSLWLFVEGKDELTEEDIADLEILSEKWPCPEELIWD